MRVIASTCDWRFSKLHIEPFVLFLYFTKWLHFRIRRNAKCDHHHQHHCHCRRRRCCRRRISIQRNFIAWHRMWCTHKLCCHRMGNLDKIELATRIEVAAISGAWFGRLSRTAFFPTLYVHCFHFDLFNMKTMLCIFKCKRAFCKPHNLYSCYGCACAVCVCAWCFRFFFLRLLFLLISFAFFAVGTSVMYKLFMV